MAEKIYVEIVPDSEMNPGGGYRIVRKRGRHKDYYNLHRQWDEDGYTFLHELVARFELAKILEARTKKREKKGSG